MAIWRRLAPHLTGEPPLWFIDAGSGDGAIASILAGVIPDVRRLILFEKDLALYERGKARPELQRAVHSPQDYLGAKVFGCEITTRVVVMNPPFDQAEAFVRHSLMHVAPRVIALLRLGFLESQERAPLHMEWPSDVYVLSSRPSFAHGKTDASAYAWLAWGFGSGGRWEILDCGDKAWRKANP
jgi:hypothetical protein